MPDKIYSRSDLLTILRNPDSPVRLDLGCGARKKEGYIGIDRVSLRGVDIVCDFEKGLPIEDNCVDGIYSKFLFEHIDNLIYLFQEVYRVCRNGAVVEIVVPYYASIGAFKDPTHKHFFAEETFRYFSKDRWYGSDYGFNVDFETVRITYHYMPPFNFVSAIFPFSMPVFRRFILNVVHSITVKLKVRK